MKDRILHVKTLLTDTLFDVALLYVGVWPAYLVGNGLFGLIARAVTDNDHLLAARLFEFFPSLLLMCAVIFLFWFRVEYKREKASAPRAAAAMALAGGVQILVCVLLVFTVWSCGPALPLIKVFYAGADYNLHINENDLPAWLGAVVMLSLDLFYIACAILGGYFGQKKRKADRKKLTGREN